MPDRYDAGLAIVEPLVRNIDRSASENLGRVGEVEATLTQGPVTLGGIECNLQENYRTPAKSRQQEILWGYDKSGCGNLSDAVTVGHEMPYSVPPVRSMCCRKLKDHVQVYGTGKETAIFRLIY